MPNYVVVDAAGAIINRVVVDDGAPLNAPAGTVLVLDTTGMAIGGTYIAGVYTPPAQPAPITPPTLDEIYDQTILNQKVLKALVLALNDGTLPVGTNKTNPQLKAIIKARM